MTCTLHNKEPMALINSMESYLKQRPPDCSLFSQHNYEFPIHKEVLYQTEYLREMITDLNFEEKIEILCTSIAKEELQIMVNFLYDGKISCKDQTLGSQACKNLNEMFGFPIALIDGEIKFAKKKKLHSKKISPPVFTMKYSQKQDRIVKIDNDMTNENNLSDMDDHHYDDDYHAIKPEIDIEKAEIKVEDDIEMIDSTQEDPFAEKKYGKEQKNVCLICDTGFETKMSLLMHFASEHDMKYECSDCLKLFESDFALNEHSSYAHGEDAKPIFECPTCKAEFKEEVILEDHINLIHSKEKKCSYCGKTFALIRYLNTHISKYHRDRSHVETIPCKLCDKMIVKGKQMKRHLKTCKGKVEKPVKEEAKEHLCPYCGKNSKSKIAMADHIKRIHSYTQCSICLEEVKYGYPFKKHMALKHDGEIFMCSLCGNKYYSERRLKEHVDLDHELKKACICSLCGKTFKLKSRMLVHIKHVHEGKITILKCQKCDFTCKSNLKTLRLHMEKVHEGKTYYCAQCPETFPTMVRLQGHVAFVHDRSQLFQCSICKNEYRTEQSLKDHIGFIHEKTKGATCDLCQKTFLNQGLLNRHIQTTHEGVRYQCDICNKTYSTTTALKKHVEQTHDGKDLSIKCPICNKTLSQQSVLKNHIAAVHEKKRPHECDICHERFAQTAHLKTHKKGKHKIFA